MAKLWKCEVCGYVHSGPEPPGTCPVCGVGVELFSVLELAVPSEPTPSPAAARWRCSLCDYVHLGPEPPGTCPVCGAPASFFEPAEEAGGQGAKTLVGTVVIVGAGVAGVTAAEHARSTAPEARIRLISKEPGLPYLRLNLTRFLGGEVAEEGLLMKPEGWFEKQRIELEQAEVVAISPVAHELRLRDGRAVPYDRLVLAGGAHPFVPPIPGAAREGVTTFRTLSDGSRILERARPGGRCVCIGGGLLGLETAGALRRRGLEVTVVEGFGHLLPRQLPEPAGRLLEEHLSSLGIAVHCGRQIKEITGDEGAAAVKLQDGEVLPADLVVVSAGVRPNSYLARQCGIEVDQGVVVDDRMATSVPDIYAAGDLCEHRGQVMGIWPAAFAQGSVAGINASGGSAELPSLARSNRLKVLDVDLFSIGQIQAEDASYQVLVRQGEGSYEQLVLRDQRLVGAALYGDSRLAAQVKEAVESGLAISETGLGELLDGFVPLEA
ncbi:MAG: FAD-dependent oxidoreductase [Polyangia bacterium]|jgi:nitrite reductase (NADH) large subunit|nr:FAD-dependent oxidoreductase [Polyangia bacterium]